MDDWFEHERLHFAAGDGDLAAVQTLVAEGRDVNATDSDLALTPLHYAAAGEHIDVVRFLIANGADVNAIDEATAGDTPLGHAAQECSLAMAKVLLATIGPFSSFRSVKWRELLAYRFELFLGSCVVCD